MHFSVMVALYVPFQLNCKESAGNQKISPNQTIKKNWIQIRLWKTNRVLPYHLDTLVLLPRQHLPQNVAIRFGGGGVFPLTQRLPWLHWHKT